MMWTRYYEDLHAMLTTKSLKDDLIDRVQAHRERPGRIIKAPMVVREWLFNLFNERHDGKGSDKADPLHPDNDVNQQLTLTAGPLRLPSVLLTHRCSWLDLMIENRDVRALEVVLLSKRGPELVITGQDIVTMAKRGLCDMLILVLTQRPLQYKGSLTTKQLQDLCGNQALHKPAWMMPYCVRLLFDYRVISFPFPEQVVLFILSHSPWFTEQQICQVFTIGTRPSGSSPLHPLYRDIVCRRMSDSLVATLFIHTRQDLNSVIDPSRHHKTTHLWNLVKPILGSDVAYVILGYQLDPLLRYTKKPPQPSFLMMMAAMRQDGGRDD